MVVCGHAVNLINLILAQSHRVSIGREEEDFSPAMTVGICCWLRIRGECLSLIDNETPESPLWNVCF